MSTTTKPSFSTRNINKDFEAVLGLVTDTTGIPRNKILGKTRPEPVAHARMLTYWLMREMEHSLAGIGGLLNRDHGSVLNGCRRVNDWAEVDERFRKKLKRMRDRLISHDPNEAKPKWVCPECGYAEGSCEQ